jgi:hypothetical protein
MAEKRAKIADDRVDIEVERNGAVAGIGRDRAADGDIS